MSDKMVYNIITIAQKPRKGIRSQVIDYACEKIKTNFYNISKLKKKRGKKERHIQFLVEPMRSSLRRTQNHSAERRYTNERFCG